MTVDIQNGVTTFAPPAIVGGEVAARIYGLSINEWFYVVAIVCMVLSTVASSYVAVLKVQKNKKEEADE